MKLGMAIHRAIDYFFCDRCPTEVIEGRISHFVGYKLCPLNWIWEMGILPEEEWDKNHPIFFPRSYLKGLTRIDEGKQTVGPEKYGED